MVWGVYEEVTIKEIKPRDKAEIFQIRQEQDWKWVATSVIE